MAFRLLAATLARWEKLSLRELAIGGPEAGVLL